MVKSIYDPRSTTHALAARLGTRLATVCFALLLLSGCSSVSYYMQSVNGQLDVWSRERDIDSVIADPQVAKQTRARLEYVQKVREFAIHDLKLPDNGSYLKYSDLERPYVAWNVFAAEEFSVKPVTWCYPFAGCVGYRGYFNREDAVHYAAEMKQKGFDVHVGGIAAYSTLGWFADPLLNTVIRYSNPRLARLVFHELGHQVAYAKGDSVFNESFAVTVETEGIKRWLAAHGTNQDKIAYERSKMRRAGFLRLVEGTRTRLKTLYRSDIAPELMRVRKKQIFEEMLRDYETLKKTAWNGFKGYDRWFESGPNNAHMASIAIYNQLVPAFQALLVQEGGDLPRFYEVVRQLSRKPARERKMALRAMMPSATASAK